MSVIKLIFIDTIFDILYFPIWWYSRGAVLALKWAGRAAGEAQEFLGIDIWIKNLWKPMYGQYDIAGKIISFFMRIFQIIFRSIIFLGFCVFYTILFLIYLVLPIFTMWSALFHLPGMFR